MSVLTDCDRLMKPLAKSANCPCGIQKNLERCCGPLLSGEQRALTAEQLMRSRYCAFVYRDEHYLLATWHPTTRPKTVPFDSRQRWLGLSIRATEHGSIDDKVGYVEFVARFKVNGKGHRLHEKSHFARVDDEWYYVSGDFL